jgi:hypothetical protein
MRLLINIEELFSGRAVGGDRLEYKTGWKPDPIYRTITMETVHIDMSLRSRRYRNRCLGEFLNELDHK